MTGKAGVLHLHVGDGPQGLEPVRRALAACDLPARTFQPTHVNRRRSLFDEALQLAESGVPVDLTAFPVDEGEDAWPADVALARYLESPAPQSAVTVSSDGGGCLPVFGPDGAVEKFATATPDSLLATLRAAVQNGLTLDAALPAFCSNPARILRLEERGRLRPGAIADLLVLDENLGLVGAAFSGAWHDAHGEGIAAESLQELLK
jgi:beta-aspartyl-dipeptidase (metallo-type)